MADPGLIFFFLGGGAKVQKAQKLATELAKHSVKQRETTVIGSGKYPLCPHLQDPPLLSGQ